MKNGKGGCSDDQDGCVRMGIGGGVGVRMEQPRTLTLLTQQEGYTSCGVMCLVSTRMLGVRY